MFDSLGFPELLLIGFVALIVVGPKDLPLLMRRAGQWVKKLRGMADDFRANFDDLARQAELDELRKEVEALKAMRPLAEIQEELAQPLGPGLDANARIDLKTGEAWSPTQPPAAADAAGDASGTLPPDPPAQPPPAKSRARRAAAAAAAAAGEADERVDAGRRRLVEAASDAIPRPATARKPRAKKAAAGGVAG